jgi:glycerol-3-phosphate acyltransferase PlsX
MCAVLDVGANVDCKPIHLQQFAIMGKLYYKDVFGVDNPKVGLLSIGEEDSKGNELTLSTFDILKKTNNLNFIGNVEGRDIPKGTADVVVCDGFVGNVVLKLAEGIAEMLFSLIKNEMKAHPFAWGGIPFLWAALKGIKKRIDPSEYGGAPLLGINGICIIGHGGSNEKAIKNALRAAAAAAKAQVHKDIAEEIKKYGVTDN